MMNSSFSHGLSFKRSFSVYDININVYYQRQPDPIEKIKEMLFCSVNRFYQFKKIEKKNNASKSNPKKIQMHSRYSFDGSFHSCIKHFFCCLVRLWLFIDERYIDLHMEKDANTTKKWLTSVQHKENLDSKTNSFYTRCRDHNQYQFILQFIVLLKKCIKK